MQVGLQRTQPVATPVPDERCTARFVRVSGQVMGQPLGHDGVVGKT